MLKKTFELTEVSSVTFLIATINAIFLCKPFICAFLIAHVLLLGHFSIVTYSMHACTHACTYTNLVCGDNVNFIGGKTLAAAHHPPSMAQLFLDLLQESRMLLLHVHHLTVFETGRKEKKKKCHIVGLKDNNILKGKV